MRTLRSAAVVVMTAMCILGGAIQARADVSWDSVKQKIAAGKDYEVTYKYDGPRGTFTFNYRCVPPDKIRSEITEAPKDPSKKGYVIFYDSSFAKDKVRYKGGGGVMVRALTHKDVKDSPAFYTSLFQVILDQVKGVTPKVSQEGDRTRFEFATGGGTVRIWANKNSEIVRTERTVDKVPETRDFQAIKWNSSPNMDF